MAFLFKLIIFIFTFFLGIFIFSIVLISKFLSFLFRLINGEQPKAKDSYRTNSRSYQSSGKFYDNFGYSKKSGDNFYYTYTGTGAGPGSQSAEDFFYEFFKQQSNSNYSHNKRNSSNNRNNPFEYFNEDFSKYYNVLGVNSGASKEEIRKAYLSKVKEHHPDRFGNSSPDLQAEHENKLKDINEAYNKVMNKFS